MPSVNFTVKWPNGEHVQYYSPSTVIYDYLAIGKNYPAAQFLKQAENGLYAASERVRARYGFACSSAMDSLATIKRQAKLFALKDQDPIEITAMSNE
ncbi:MSMEG_0570 family nitrogen starvation response protein [Acinetobacter baumannii]|uniref:MSMEG_0570 family nitrogen starvation response protein n=1 Tax=Acinetobacter baumannii TaxID=470 RepID=UPI0023415474|nr:MSMEG_0570 family nitrogen starvation response protein [Acinetobacter baumannii]MDC4261630.1 MSMEG_0570 family nitrogen starvation response protein [Acinetobacter baumannii]MDH2526196.1 MSMEG_0570 family nitrogen starvation response protein [Acinetobacter baumannii]MDH2631234.1 MSMEG_0570 family nitrogen starvation response protein [Acinetobacter baumannii]MDO7453485.1 MSMEG_0570 family nitrogen starvation response protein [Acinetobacter baumannii]HCA5261283.1 MSMEG_0570 family nitrogen sta